MSTTFFNSQTLDGSSSFHVIQEVLPNLPQYRQKRTPIGKKLRTLDVVNGDIFIRPGLPPISTNSLIDDHSVNSLGSPSLLAKSRPRSPEHEVHLILTYQAYFEELEVHNPAGSDPRVRKCNIYFYVEDQTISIVEKPQINSGIPQGTIVKRSVPCKPDGLPYGVEDFRVGADLVIHGRTYHIYDCDGATRRYIKYRFDESMEDAYEPPRDIWSAETDRRKKNEEWGRFHSKKNHNKTFMEAMLGNTVNNTGRAGFIEYGNKTLKFLCVWDNKDKLYGDRLEFCLTYYLSDDTIEIFSQSAGGELFSRLLKRSRLPKHPHMKTLGESAVEDYYHWEDFYIGLELNVYSRRLRIVDSDNSTRMFYKTINVPMGDAEAPPAPIEVYHEREIPPSTGFGSEEDSLRSCQGSLMPGPIHHKMVGEDKKLIFTGCLLSGTTDDVDRRFVITYFVQDNTIKIQEPPVRNSGFVGGVFLSRRVVKTEGGDPISHLHLYVGAKLQVLKHKFLILGANENTMRWMEDKKHPRSSFYDILEKIKPFVLADAMSGALASKFESLDVSGQGRCTQQALTSILKEYDLLGDDKISEHELMSIVRANGNKKPTFDYNKMIDQLINPTDEYK